MTKTDLEQVNGPINQQEETKCNRATESGPDNYSYC